MKLNKNILDELAINITDGEHGSVIDDNNGNFYLLSNKNIINGNININSNDRKISEYSFNKIKKRTKLEKNDLVISTVGTIGKLAIIKDNNINYEFQRSVGIIKCDKKKLTPEYLYYYFSLPYIQKMLVNLSKGAVQKCLFISDLKNLVIEYPNDIKNQIIICNILSTLDKKIEINNRINEELEAMAKTLYDYWFVQFEFPFDFAQGKPSEKGKPYKSSGGKMVWNEELKREIPEGWENGFLSNLADIIGGSTPSKEINEYFSSNGTAWITPKDLSLNAGNKFITKGEIDVSEKGIKSASLNILPKGTILLSSRAPIGYMAISRNSVTTNQGFKSFVPKQGYSSFFIFYIVKNSIPTIINNASGSTFKEVSASVLKTISVCLPPKNIIEKFTDIVNSIFEKQNNLELETKKLAELRDWLLPMLMNGQVSVN